MAPLGLRRARGPIRGVSGRSCGAGAGLAANDLGDFFPVGGLTTIFAVKSPTGNKSPTGSGEPGGGEPDVTGESPGTSPGPGGGPARPARQPDHGLRARARNISSGYPVRGCAGPGSGGSQGRCCGQGLAAATAAAPDRVKPGTVSPEITTRPPSITGQCVHAAARFRDHVGPLDHGNLVGVIALLGFRDLAAFHDHGNAVASWAGDSGCGLGENVVVDAMLGGPAVARAREWLALPGGGIRPVVSVTGADGKAELIAHSAWLGRLAPTCACGSPRLGSGRTCGSAECVTRLAGQGAG